MAAVASTSSDRLEFPPRQQPMDRSPSKSAFDSTTDSSASSTADVSESNLLYFPSPSNKDAEVQSQVASRSEEYRQLFRLPSDEVFVKDFNCAFQENILIQGHMYLFVHYVCFYSNIFGFETKKVIPFQEVTTVRKAKTAGIFPNAIEMLAGSKKYFFGSFLSRDEAFKFINDRWLQQDDKGNSSADSQDIISDSSSRQENNIMVEEEESPRVQVNELDSTGRNTVPSPLQESLDPSNFEGDNTSTPSERTVNVELVEVPIKEPIIGTTHASSSSNWKEENSDAPKVPDYFTKVAESKFPIKVKDFFSLFFSDDAVDFIASFHGQCGDKDFKCSSWYINDKFGHARDVSFQHPIKIYLGARCGSCHEIQKFQLYRNSSRERIQTADYSLKLFLNVIDGGSHMVIETSQEISDVPYSDYFRVEALWDVMKDTSKSNECCILEVYVNVAFSKKTVFKGKIVQSTVEECREVYAIWINMAHELLTRKNLEKQEERGPDSTIKNGRDHRGNETKTGESFGRSNEPNNSIRLTQTSRSIDFNQEARGPVQENDTTSLATFLREPVTKFSSIFKSANNLPYLLIIVFVVILLMQLSIVMLLSRPQHIHLSSPDHLNNMGSGGGAITSEDMAWLEKRIHHLNDEMYMVEGWLERMKNEHRQLMLRLKDLETLSKRR